jgi:hypothetical protein
MTALSALPSSCPLRAGRRGDNRGRPFYDPLAFANFLHVAAGLVGTLVFRGILTFVTFLRDSLGYAENRGPQSRLSLPLLHTVCALNRLIKAVLIAAGVPVILAVATVFGLNLYVGPAPLGQPGIYIPGRNRTRISTPTPPPCARLWRRRSAS